jgi:hypothetical protein
MCEVDNLCLPAINAVQNRNENYLTTVTFTPARVLNLIKVLKNSSSAGPDGIPAIFLKKLKFCLSKPISRLFNCIFSLNVVPDVWKHAFVVPIFKKGKSSCIQNYRPISITCDLCKLFERVIKIDLVNFLVANNILNSAQHGFVSKFSTSTNLLQSLNDWTLSIRNGNYCRVAYIDFAKAFDSVCHSKLLFKLSNMGINGSLYNIIQSYLDSRTQQVRIDNCFSSIINIVSGVPQGSVFGPLLFVIYVNDITNCLPDCVNMRLFADDVKLYSVIKCELDIAKFQDGLNNLEVWANEWQLKISISKCCIMDLSRNRNIVSNYSNSLLDANLDCVDKYRDLGVIIDNRLTFKPHILEIVSKAKQRISLIFRTFLTRDSIFLVKSFKSFILPIVDYCSQIWTPYLIHDILLIESIQRGFTKRIPALSGLSYSERLKQLDLQTLERRRLNFALVLCFKIVHSYVNGQLEDYGLVLSKRPSRGHSLKLTYNNPKTNVQKHFFSCRVCDPWNFLGDDLVMSSSVYRFKTKLRTTCKS